MRNTEKNPIKQKIARTGAKGWGAEAAGLGELLPGIWGVSGAILGQNESFGRDPCPSRTGQGLEPWEKFPDRCCRGTADLGWNIHGNVPEERPWKRCWGRRRGGA